MVLKAVCWVMRGYQADGTNLISLGHQAKHLAFIDPQEGHRSGIFGSRLLEVKSIYFD